MTSAYVLRRHGSVVYVTGHQQPRRIADEATAAEYMHTTERHLRDLRQKRKIPFIRLGDKLVRYDLDSIDEWLDAHRVEAVG